MGVHSVRKPNGKVYYYYAPGRGTAQASGRVPLPGDIHSPEFWIALRDLRSGEPAHPSGGTWAELIEAYRTSPEWEHLRPVTRCNYNAYLDRLAAMDGKSVAAMTSADVYQLRDYMAGSPSSANYMLAVLRTVIEWSIPRGYRHDNPAAGVKRLRVEEKGAAPWPEDGYQFVLDHAPTSLRRMAFLGRVTGQRASDLVRMKPVDLAADGIIVRISKRRELKHFVPLTAAELAEIKSWGVDPLDLFIKTPRSLPFTARHLGAYWRYWQASDAAKPIQGLQMTIHGLRATKVADLRLAGVPDGSVATEIGMSVQMVSRYSRFADKTDQARASRDRRERKEDRVCKL
jgi:integrase